MGRVNGLRTAGVVVGVMLAAGVAAAQGPRADLKGLASDLRLTGGGVQSWMDALGVSGNASATERLLAVTRDGRRIASRDGSRQHVPLGAEFDQQLLTAGAGITLVHNHPGSVGLSADDLLQLAKAGVVAVIAIGHDGSVYMAAAGPRFDRDRFEDLQYAPVRAEVERKLREARASAAIAPAVSDAYQAHVVSLALAKAHVIEYRATLAPDRKGGYDRARVVLGPAAETASGRVPKITTDDIARKSRRADD